MKRDYRSDPQAQARLKARRRVYRRKQRDNVIVGFLVGLMGVGAVVLYAVISASPFIVIALVLWWMGVI